jgi:hypothetical protein
MSSSAPLEVPFEELDREIIEAHAQADGARLAKLYALAAQHLMATQKSDRAAFLLVNAYVWALEAGEESIAADAHRALVEMGREQ